MFLRTIGETSDIVTKEMYTFTDRGGEEITLRPEYTAGVARAVHVEWIRPKVCRSNSSRPVRCSATNGRRKDVSGNSIRSASNYRAVEGRRRISR